MLTCCLFDIARQSGTCRFHRSVCYQSFPAQTPCIRSLTAPIQPRWLPTFPKRSEGFSAQASALEGAVSAKSIGRHKTSLTQPDFKVGVHCSEWAAELSGSQRIARNLHAVTASFSAESAQRRPFGRGALLPK